MRSELREDLRDLLATVELAARALEADSTFAPARFTMAVGLGRLGLVDRATEAWASFLRVDSTSDWAAEARQRRGAMRSAPTVPPARPASHQEAVELARQDPQTARLLALDSLLPEWGEATLAGDSTRARGANGSATSLGSALVAQGGDRSLGAMTAAITQAVSPRARSALARAHSAYGRANALYASGDYDGCNQELDAMDAAGYVSVLLGHWGAILRGMCVLHSSPPAASIRHFRAIMRVVDTVAYPALAARARWGAALAFSKAARSLEGLPLVAESQSLFARAGEREHLGAVQHIEGFSRMRLQQTTSSLEAIRRSIRSLSGLRTSPWLHNVLYVLADMANTAGYPRAAVQVSSEAIGIADRRADPRLMTESRIARARFAAASGLAALSQRDLDSASQLVGRIPAGAAREWQYADLISLLSANGALGRSDRRLASLDSVVVSFARVGTPDKLVPALAARAGAALERGDTTRPAADLATAVDLIERSRTTVPAAMLVTLIDASRSMLRRLAMLYVSLGRVDDALAAIERSRFSMRGAPRASAATPPRGTAIISLAFVHDTLLSWTITSRGQHFTRSVTNHRLLSEEIDRMSARLELGVMDSTTRDGLSRIFDSILRNALVPLGSTDSVVVIVADESIEAAPLAAAFDSATGTYLVERFIVRHAPSVADALSADARLPDAPMQALLIADPAFDPATYPGLPRLPGAQEETRALQALYPLSLTLSDSGATSTRVTRAISSASVIHFAGHALYDARNPDESELVLAAAPGAGQEARLRAAEISTWTLPRTPLVVLAACESSLPRFGDSAGTNSLTTAFLVAGARGVVGSLWRVNDALARPLMIEFHRRARAGHDGAAALRMAQLALLRSPDVRLRSPSAWAAFRYTGK